MGENVVSQEIVVQVQPKTVCQAYVIARTVKERDLGKDMPRIHAENHGLEHASKLRMSELVAGQQNWVPQSVHLPRL